MRLEPNDGICPLCRGDVEPRAIRYAGEVNGQVVIVRDVPAQVCTQCGEEYLTEATETTIRQIVERGKPEGTQRVDVYVVGERG